MSSVLFGLFFYLLWVSSAAEPCYTVSSDGKTLMSGKGCASNVTIGKDITTIGCSAFLSNTNIKSIKFEEGSQIRVISSLAFAFSSLKDINIPSTVKTINYWAFYSCTALESITVDSDCEHYSTNDGVLFMKVGGSRALVQYPTGNTRNEYIIPDDTVAVYPWSFSFATHLTKVTIPTQVDVIQGHIFEGCTNLKSVTTGTRIKEIGWYAFSGCSSLSGFSIPSTVSKIGLHAFSGCSSLSSVTIPSGVEKVEEWTFSHCSNLKNVIIADGSQLTAIGNHAFMSCQSLESITIPPTVKDIGNRVFYQCTGLNRVEYAGESISCTDDVFEETSIKEENIDLKGRYAAGSFCGITVRNGVSSVFVLSILTLVMLFI